MTILINPQIRLLAAGSLLLITLLCCPSVPESTLPSMATATKPTPQRLLSTPVATSPAPTPTPGLILALGEWLMWGDLSLSVESYEVVDECRDWGSGPAEGAKLLYVWIAMRNHGDEAVPCPACRVAITYGGQFANVAGGRACMRDDQSLGNACYDRMYPGVECRGWELFEIPLARQVEGTLVEVLSSELPERDPVAAWRLPGGPGE